MIKVIKEKTMKRFTDSLAFAIYPNIYVREGWQYTDWLIEHEKLHIKEQKEMGVYKWLFKYLVNKEFRYQAELRAYKVSIAHGLAATEAARMLAKHYRLEYSYHWILADLLRP